MILCIVGPTGSGKTKLSIELAKKWNGEIINADSTQVYRGLDIATAKVTEEEKEGIVHHLLDIKEVIEDYTVYDYQKDCRQKIDDILSRGKTPIIVGGTGLYIKAVLYDYQLEQENNSSMDTSQTTEELYQRLIQVDPNTEIHANNRKRICRALQYYENTGKRFSEKEKNNEMIYPAIVIGLTLPRPVLYERINTRVEQMMENGLLKEAKHIFDSNIRSKAIMTPIGYKELFPYFEDKDTLENCIRNIKQHSRNYAKRQYTWFKNQMEVNWITVDLNHFENTIEETNKIIENRE